MWLVNIISKVFAVFMSRLLLNIKGFVSLARKYTVTSKTLAVFMAKTEIKFDIQPSVHYKIFEDR